MDLRLNIKLGNRPLAGVKLVDSSGTCVGDIEIISTDSTDFDGISYVASELVKLLKSFEVSDPVSDRKKIGIGKKDTRPRCGICSKRYRSTESLAKHSLFCSSAVLAPTLAPNSNVEKELPKSLKPDAYEPTVTRSKAVSDTLPTASTVLENSHAASRPKSMFKTLKKKPVQLRREKSIFCVKCFEKFANRAELLKHKIDCATYKKPINRKDKAAESRRSDRGQRARNYFCVRCFHNFPDTASLGAHKEVCKLARTFTKATSSPREILVSQKIHECIKCHHVFPTTSDLDLHSNVCSTKRRLPTNFINKSHATTPAKSSKPGRKPNVELESDPPTFFCGKCHRKFSIFSVFKNHKRKCTPYAENRERIKLLKSMMQAEVNFSNSSRDLGGNSKNCNQSTETVSKARKGINVKKIRSSNGIRSCVVQIDPLEADKYLPLVDDSLISDHTADDAVLSNSSPSMRDPWQAYSPNRGTVSEQCIKDAVRHHDGTKFSQSETPSDSSQSGPGSTSTSSSSISDESEKSPPREAISRHRPSVHSSEPSVSSSAKAPGSENTSDYASRLICEESVNSPARYSRMNLNNPQSPEDSSDIFWCEPNHIQPGVSQGFQQYNAQFTGVPQTPSQTSTPNSALSPLNASMTESSIFDPLLSLMDESLFDHQWSPSQI